MIDNLNRKQDSYWERSGKSRPIWFQFLSIAKDDLRLKKAVCSLKLYAGEKGGGGSNLKL